MKRFLFICNSGAVVVRHHIVSETAEAAAAEHSKNYPTHEFLSALALGRLKKRKAGGA
ncbi:MAG: hypothetical protein ACLQEQ_05650 [Nitrososphaerales archaeon]